MASSAQDLSHTNRETLSTASAIRAETVTRSHIFKVFGYSLTKWIGIRKYVTSDVFMVGGYEWLIRYYPDGEREDDKDFVAFFLVLESDANDVKVKFSFTMLDQNGALSSGMSEESHVTFNGTTGTKFASWGYSQFTERTEFEASKCLNDDAFTLSCTVTVVKGSKLEAINPYGIPVPPANMNQQLIGLLESGEGADVTFVVNDQIFKAHRWMLAARSAVFKAGLLGGMKDKFTDTIIVDDIEATVFKSTLYFIYSDSMPNFEGFSDALLEHLLVAADRYALERLRLMCEDVLSKNLSVSNVASMLILAERHNCSLMRVQCLRFMGCPDVLKAVVLTDAFHNLMKICPSVLKDI